MAQDNRTAPSRSAPAQQARPSANQSAQQTRAPEQKMPPTAGAGDQAPALYTIPDPARARGISEDQWFTMRKSLFPGALPESVIMVWDYCKARRLDPMKKPCHIVPMEVTVKTRGEGGQITEKKEWRDIVMPGIYEYRTTAMRTGLYLGHTEPEYGDDIEAFGVNAPYWCSMTMYRWNEKAQRVTEFPVKVFFEEICATKWGKEPGERVANAKWKQSPIQMLTKCTEAAGLREAFPDELGGEHTVDEMEGRGMEDDRIIVTQQAGQTRADAAKEALRATAMKQAPVVPAATSADPPAAKQQEGAPAQPAQTPQQPTKAISNGNPWDDPQAPADKPAQPAEEDPKAKAARMIATFNERMKAVKEWAQVKAIFGEALDYYDGINEEIPLDVEATMHMMKEKLGAN